LRSCAAEIEELLEMEAAEPDVEILILLAEEEILPVNKICPLVPEVERKMEPEVLVAGRVMAPAVFWISREAEESGPVTEILPLLARIEMSPAVESEPMEGKPPAEASRMRVPAEVFPVRVIAELV
jgi:hypothetical protein